MAKDDLCFGSCLSGSSKGHRIEMARIPHMPVPFVIIHDERCDAMSMAEHEDAARAQWRASAREADEQTKADIGQLVADMAEMRTYPPGASFFQRLADVPDSCYPGNPRCSWVTEQDGYEEKARFFRLCETHGTEGRRVSRAELEAEYG